MALYGYRAMPQRSSDPYKDYFKDVREDIETNTLVEKAKQTAEDAAMKALGEIPTASESGMYHAYGDAGFQMASILKEKWPELSKTEEGRQELQKLMEGYTFWTTESKGYYNEVNPVLSRNMKIAKSGANPKEWEDLGLQDSRSYADYQNKVAELDTARFQVGIKNGEWVITDEAGEHSINDTSLMDLSYFADENYLEQTPFPKPESWWITNHQDSKYKNEEEALAWVRAQMEGSKRGRLDAVRWAEEKGLLPEGMTADEAIDKPGRVEEAITDYARAAVPEGWEPETTSTSSSSTSTRPSSARTVDTSVISTSSSGTRTMPNEADDALIDAPDSASYPMDDPLTINAANWTGVQFPAGQNKLFKMSGMSFSVDDGLQVLTLQGDNITIEQGSADHTGLRRQFDAEYGSGSFDDLVEELRTQALESSDSVIPESERAQWLFDHSAGS